MSTRKRSKNQQSANAPATSTGNVRSAEDLPPPRARKGMKPVKPPGSNVDFNTFIYRMGLVGVLVLAFYAWRLWVWKAEAGGWWNLATGKKPEALGVRSPASSSTGGIDDAQRWAKGSGGQGVVEIESRIEQLASALGMPSKDLASAIAGAVRDYVPPATLSSVSAQAKKTPGAGSEVVDELLGEHHEADSATEKVAGGVQSALEGLVGMDEPPAMS
ncbi:hypothetical protein GLOTRDRAFT_117208 [Gloeophyllum trabeum ATCC 11539]|uniref:Uncharacterized protein n=1 Tax=Gloeophyllum trabeum (strain ATCC 11539 / FP-39264 / Madison 617) TaxID=670483 RepID=S7RFY8_GLOTA|nr:uncharacterized protein GLOTRDRAFT_117208 [Gloeophyllum trabeum ATCC 11539]EPQ53120.1 hypothetical protein GLOTRDRAFT_117208 [Gloeophyllum trabeum ATCC 11539]